MLLWKARKIDAWKIRKNNRVKEEEKEIEGYVNVEGLIKLHKN